MRIANGIRGEDVKKGDGALAERGRYVTIRFTCRLNHGDEVRAGTESFLIGGRRIIAGLERGVIGMRVGGIRKLQISPHLAYRDQEVTGIPPNSALRFEVELLEVTE
jgi:FKBP-type peptidyl-prolyl cis-trans isomerase